MTSLTLKMILLFRQACASSGHADHAEKTTFRAWIGGPLSGALSASHCGHSGGPARRAILGANEPFAGLLVDRDITPALDLIASVWSNEAVAQR